MGNVDVLCTDKTGTLTQNKVKVQDIVDPSDQSDPEIIKYALLCNSAIIEGDKILGNPIDVAIWNHARENRFNEANLNTFTRIHEIPFGFARRRMSVVVKNDNRLLLISKGAPESIANVATSVGNEIESQPIPNVHEKITSLIEKYSQTGNRLIAIAIKEVEEKPDYSTADEQGLRFVGLLVLSDPLKEDAAPAISRLKLLGIKLKILSGDDPVVTEDVCRKLGIDFQGKVLTGVDVENMQEDELRKAVEENDVFARVSPEQKYAIVSALKKNGHVTGFLGDGVNDAPALKLADAGISVDSGVQVAKEASSVILLERVWAPSPMEWLRDEKLLVT